ncbi:MAG: hypothetical protein ACSLE1_17085 [Sphingobium sp.]
MKISVIFDLTFQGTASGAIWIVESDENRRWFNRQEELDEWSAVFTPEGGEVGRTAIMRTIWNVQEHYPKWSEIAVSGVSLTSDISSDLKEEGGIRENEQGFSLIRL